MRNTTKGVTLYIDGSTKVTYTGGDVVAIVTTHDLTSAVSAIQAMEGVECVSVASGFTPDGVRTGVSNNVLTVTKHADSEWIYLLPKLTDTMWNTLFPPTNQQIPPEALC